LNFKSLRFLDKELFTDLPEGSLREADLVAQVETVDSEPEMLLIHVEVQADREPDFEARMFQYYALLWLRYRIPIFPIVVYLRGGAAFSGEAYRVRLLGREVLDFRYEGVGLKALDAEAYAKLESPVAAALAALMNREGKPGVLELRVLMLQAVARSRLDAARKFLLLNLVETYFGLTPDESDAFGRLLAQAEFQEVREMQVTWADRMKEEGRQEGRQEGREQGRQAGVLEGKRETLLRQLTLKFGALPVEVVAQVEALDSMSELDKCLDRILSARSLEDTGLVG